MANDNIDRNYTIKDINKAFSMGQESAVVILEKSVGLSIEGQRLLINCLKKRIAGDKIKAMAAKTKMRCCD